MMELKTKTLEIIFNLLTEQVIKRTKDVILDNGIEIGTSEVGQQVEVLPVDEKERELINKIVKLEKNEKLLALNFAEDNNNIGVSIATYKEILDGTKVIGATPIYRRFVDLTATNQKLVNAYCNFVPAKLPIENVVE
jgi:hypothetical protein